MPRWRRTVNAALQRTGYQLTRAPVGPPPTWRNGKATERARTRLVPAPVFVMCTARSGSTLLRVLLNNHPKVRSPHELHLYALHVDIEKDYAEKASRHLGMDKAELEYQLWDRILFRELQRSNKQVIVDKTPQNAFVWKRLAEAWPHARFIYLQRHPAAILASMLVAAPTIDPETVAGRLRSYLRYLEAARAALPGLVVRYEDLAKEPEITMREVCDFIDVPYDAGMLQYDPADHGPLVIGLGDWGDKINSGCVQDAAPPPADICLDEQLTAVARAWGYL